MTPDALPLDIHNYGEIYSRRGDLLKMSAVVQDKAASLSMVVSRVCQINTDSSASNLASGFSSVKSASND